MHTRCDILRDSRHIGRQRRQLGCTVCIAMFYKEGRRIGQEKPRTVDQR